MPEPWKPNVGTVPAQAPKYFEGDAFDIRGQFLTQIKREPDTDPTVDGYPLVTKGKGFAFGRIGPDGFGVPGVILPYGGATAPTGWLLCQGQSLLRTQYPNLFAVIGVAFGAVDAAHFTLPNFKGSFPVGFDVAQVEFNAIGKVGGAKTSSHSHTLSDLGQAAIFIQATAAPNLIMRRITSASWTATLQGDATTVAANAAAQTNGAALKGSTDANAPAILPPYLTVNFIIKT